MPCETSKNSVVNNTEDCVVQTGRTICSNCCETLLCRENNKCVKRETTFEENVLLKYGTFFIKRFKCFKFHLSNISVCCKCYFEQTLTRFFQ